MVRIARQTCAVLTALAVLLVSVTCSSAGCVLERAVAAGAHPCHNCCGAPQGQPASAPPQQGRCPLCRPSVLIGKTVEKNTRGAQRQTLSPVLFAALPANACALPGLALIRPAGPVHLNCGTPPTLLALHCALLN